MEVIWPQIITDKHFSSWLVDLVSIVKSFPFEWLIKTLIGFLGWVFTKYSWFFSKNWWVYVIISTSPCPDQIKTFPYIFIKNMYQIPDLSLKLLWCFSYKKFDYNEGVWEWELELTTSNFFLITIIISMMSDGVSYYQMEY